MGLLFCQEPVSDVAQLAVTEQPCEPSSSLCELVLIMYKILERIVDDIEISTRELRPYQIVARKIIAVAKEQSELELSEMVKHMRTLSDRLLPDDPLLEGLTATKRAVLEFQGCCSARGTWEHQKYWWAIVQQESKGGCKRALTELELETEMEIQHYEGYWVSTIREWSARRIQHSRRTKAKWSGHSRGGRNPNPEQLNVKECIKSVPCNKIYNWYDISQKIIREDRDEKAISTSSPDSVPGVEDCNPVASLFCSMLLAKAWAVRDLIVIKLRCLSRKKRTIEEPPEEVDEISEAPAGLNATTLNLSCTAIEPNKTTSATGWDSLPYDLQQVVLSRLRFEDLFRSKRVSKSWVKLIDDEDFGKLRDASPESVHGSFTAINYYIKNKAWQCTGFDLHSRTWRSLPTFSLTLPAPDAENFKEYSVSSHHGLVCADVAKAPKKGELVVFNPLTRKTFSLPSLPNPRSPVLVHISVDPTTKSYAVIVAGSSSAGDEHLSKKVEVFHSTTSQWEEAPDVPGPAFGLNEHQGGVCVDGALYFIAFLEGGCGRGVVAFDVGNKRWLDNKACPIPFSTFSNTLQLVETGGEVYLFSEQERGGSVEHCIDILETPRPGAGAPERRRWRNVLRVKKPGGRGLQVYPEHTCVPFGEGRLCVFNTLTCDGVVYDVHGGKQVDVLRPPPPHQKGDNFFSLNPATFTLHPGFDSDPVPPAVDAHLIPQMVPNSMHAKLAKDSKYSQRTWSGNGDKIDGLVSVKGRQSCFVF